MYKSNYSRDLVDNCIKKFSEKLLAAKRGVSTNLKKELVIALPYLDKLSFEIRKRINHIEKNKHQYCYVLLVLQNNLKISDFFTFKDKNLSSFYSDITCKFQCGG